MRSTLPKLGQRWGDALTLKHGNPQNGGPQLSLPALALLRSREAGCCFPCGAPPTLARPWALLSLLDVTRPAVPPAAPSDGDTSLNLCCWALLNVVIPIPKGHRCCPSPCPGPPRLAVPPPLPRPPGTQVLRTGRASDTEPGRLLEAGERAQRFIPVIPWC